MRPASKIYKLFKNGHYVKSKYCYVFLIEIKLSQVVTHKKYNYILWSLTSKRLLTPDIFVFFTDSFKSVIIFYLY